MWSVRSPHRKGRGGRGDVVPLVASGDLWSTKDTSSSSILGSDYLTSLCYCLASTSSQQKTSIFNYLYDVILPDNEKLSLLEAGGG